MWRPHKKRGTGREEGGGTGCDSWSGALTAAEPFSSQSVERGRFWSQVYRQGILEQGKGGRIVWRCEQLGLLNRRERTGFSSYDLLVARKATRSNRRKEKERRAEEEK